jgi:putative alpha-1,2-mannosidase
MGKALVARLDFGTLDTPLEVKVAISSVDEAGAIANLNSEPGDFDAIRVKTKAKWEKALDAVDFDAPAPMKKSLTTALYHALLAPSVAGDVDGRYRGRTIRCTPRPASPSAQPSRFGTLSAPSTRC